MIQTALTEHGCHAIGRPVSRLLTILMGLVLLLSMATGAVAHASEQICSPVTEVSASVGHSDGDGDQLPDTDKGVPHHHGGCHGHHVAAPADHKVAAGPIASSSDLLAGATTIAASVLPDTSLRPPIA